MHNPPWQPAGQHWVSLSRIAWHSYPAPMWPRTCSSMVVKAAAWCVSATSNLASLAARSRSRCSCSSSSESLAAALRLLPRCLPPARCC